MKYERYYGLLRKASFENWDSVKKSKICGCYYCGKIFPSSEIRENGIPPCDDGDWIQDKNGRTVLCPYCGIDSVYGDGSGIPINDEILTEFHFREFGSLGINKFYEQSLDIIEAWQRIDLSSPSTYKTVPFLEAQKKKGSGLLKEKYLDLMPEPFWGDPDNCLAAIINLNPGFGDDDKDYIGKEAFNNCHLLSDGYLDFAKANPYFTHAWFHPAATSWWAKRLSWLHKVLECQGSWRLPFMTELCPWHSAKWGEAHIDFSTYKPDYVLNVLDAAAYAANSAWTPIFAIGKAGDIYKNYLGDPVQFWGPEDNKLDTLREYSKEPLEWPRKKKKGEDDESDINVSFDYYKSELNGREIKLLNIWMLGSNHTPSDAFLPIERAILKYIEDN